MSQDWEDRLETWLASRWSLAVLLGATALSFVGALGAGFVWDDTGLVLQNELTASWSSLPTIFTSDLWDGAPVEKGISGYYRPLMILSLLVDYQLWGHSSLGHHLHSLIWHLLSVFLLLKVIETVLSVRWAWFSAAVFALHGVQSEVVIWISARNDSMAFALGLAALWFSLKPPSGWRGPLLVFLFTVLAGLTKESVLLLPLLLWVLVRMSGEARGLKAYAPMVAGIGLVGAIRTYVGVGSAQLPDAQGWWLLGSRIGEILGLIGQLIWVPWPLSSGYALEWLDRLDPWRVYGGLGLLAVWVGLCLYTRGERGRVLRWALAWTGLCLLPMLPALASKGLFGERYLYMAMVGFGISLAVLLDRRPWVFLPMFLGWVVCTQLRIPDWQSDVQMWDSAVRTLPTPYSHGGLGNALRTAGQNEDALSHFILAIDDPLPNREVCPQLVGTTLTLEDSWGAYQLGTWAEAEKGCSSAPRAAEFQAKMALAAAWTGHSDEAAERLALAVEAGHDPEPVCSKVILAVSQVHPPRSGYRMGLALEEEGHCGEGAESGSFHAVMALAAGRAGWMDPSINRLGRAMQLESVDGLCSQVVEALNLAGQSDALAVSEMVSAVRDIGCLSQEDAGVVAGELASSLVLGGAWIDAIELLDSAPLDPSGQAQVVQGAWALQQEDQARYQSIRETMDDPDRYDRIVGQLLEDATR